MCETGDTVAAALGLELAFRGAVRFTVILVGPLYEIRTVPDILCEKGTIVSS